MIRFRVLGTLELIGDEGQTLHSVLTQPKRQALLACLALATRRGVQSRGPLLTLFWPDLEESRARAALSRAIHYLRVSLGAETLRSVGNDGLALDRERFWCDVTEFEDALDRGDAAAALDLYGGDLLPGFHLPDAADFERWLEDERSRLRKRAAQAAMTAADAEEKAGRTAAAVELVRRGLALAPYDERVLRRLVALLDAAGDRAGGIRAYDAFAARLHEELELEPSPESRALVDAVRARDEAQAGPGADAGSLPRTSAAADRTETAGPGPAADSFVAAASSPDPTHVEAGPSPAGAPAAAPRAAPDAHPRRRPRRRSRRRIVLAVLPILIAGGWWLRGRVASSGNEAAPAPPLVPVLPFAVEGGVEAAYLGEGLVDLLSSSLGGTVMRTVDPRAVLRVVDGGDAGSLDPETARSIAARFGAGYALVGQVLRLQDGRLRVDAALYDRQRGADPVARASARGDIDAISALVRDVTRQILAVRPFAGVALKPRDHSPPTNSPVALRAYLEGQTHFRAGRYADAVAAYQRAVEADTSFGLAYFRLSSAADWAGPPALSRWAAERALLHAARLPQIERLRLESWSDYLVGRPVRAERGYRAILANAPTDIQAWFYLGETLYHWGPSLGRPAADAREPFERVVALDPQHAGALLHLARLAALDGRRHDLDALTARVLRLRPDAARTHEALALRSLALADDSAAAALAGDDPPADFLLPLLAPLTALDPELGLRAAERLARGAAEAVNRDIGAVARVQIELLRGRTDAALAATAGLSPARRLEVLAAAAVAPLHATPAAETARLRDAIAATPAAARVGPGDVFLRTDAIYPPRRLLLLGLLDLELGDEAGAAERAARLEDFQGFTRPDRGFAADYARILRAELARRSGDAARALEALGPPGVPPDSVLRPVIDYPHAHARFLRAELLRELGRTEEALEAYAAFPDPGGYDLMYLSAARRRAAELRRRSGG